MCSKRKIGTILRLNNESFEDEELSYETVEIGNGFANSMSTVMKTIKKFDKKELPDQEKEFIYFKWEYEQYYKNYKIIRTFISSNWWRYWSSRRWKKKSKEVDFLELF